MRQNPRLLPFVIAGVLAMATSETTAGAMTTAGRQPVASGASASELGAKLARARHPALGAGGMTHVVETNRWAGYFTIRPVVTSISGSWVVPRISCSTVDARSSTWVGVGGLSGGALLQAGMYDNCLGGAAVQGSFAEQYPGSTVSFELYVKPGDVVTATVAKGASGWYARVTDVTTHETEVARAPDYRGGSSGEWMVEAYGLP